MSSENIKTLISISLVSNRIKEVKGLFDSIDATTSIPQRVEIIIGIDAGDQEMLNFLNKEKAVRTFKIKYLISLYEGFEQLWKAFNKMHLLCDKEAYFVQHSNDEMRFITKNWDEKLEKYIGFIPDEIFRLRLSKFKLFNYSTFVQALGQPDNFAIHTKKWIDITGWCDCHSADLYQQMISLYLSRGCPEWNYNTIFYRDIAIFDIEIGGLEAGIGENDEQQIIREKRCQELWQIAMSERIQSLMQYQANLLRATILSFGKSNICYIDKKDDLCVELYEIDEQKNWKLLYIFKPYKRTSGFNIDRVKDKMEKNIKTIKKPSFLRKNKLNFLWPIVKVAMVVTLILKSLVN